MRDKSDLYYECHITIEPINDPHGISLVQDICMIYDFKMARFNMLADGEQARTFISGRDQSYSRMFKRMINCINKLKTVYGGNGFKILRYKIEDTIIDSNSDGDEILGLLK